MESATYKDAGVDYDPLDAFKRVCLREAARTSANITRHHGFSEFEASRGESVYLIETPTSFIAHVEEGLGTKNLVADAMHGLTGKWYYHKIAQCAVAMIVNDMVTLGALPLSVAMHLAVESGDWFQETDRAIELAAGWKQACNLARCAWGGGETPALRNIVVPGASLISGSAVGVVPSKEKLISPTAIRAGDVIIIIESSGIHANGLTLARRIASNLREGYLTELPNGRTYGRTLLDPTHIYVGLVEDCMKRGVSIHYAVNITGHGWRKLMRAPQPFTYAIDTLPTQLPIFEFMQKHGPITDLEAYGNLNMGAGFALYVREVDVDGVLAVAREQGLKAFVAGHIEDGEKKVLIKPKGLEFRADTLAVR